MSREIDVRVAGAMGCKVKWDILGGRREAFCGCPAPRGIVPHEQANTYVSRVLARYSEDIAAAYQVVEWMRERGWYVAVDWDKRGCSVWVSCESKFPAWVTGPEFPEALCRAFLEAAGK